MSHDDSIDVEECKREARDYLDEESRQACREQENIEEYE